LQKNTKNFNNAREELKKININIFHVFKDFFSIVYFSCKHPIKRLSTLNVVFVDCTGQQRHLKFEFTLLTKRTAFIGIGLEEIPCRQILNLLGSKSSLPIGWHRA